MKINGEIIIEKDGEKIKLKISEAGCVIFNERDVPFGTVEHFLTKISGIFPDLFFNCYVPKSLADSIEETYQLVRWSLVLLTKSIKETQNRIAAIKNYRIHTGCKLVEAKNYVDGIEIRRVEE